MSVQLGGVTQMLNRLSSDEAARCRSMRLTNEVFRLIQYKQTKNSLYIGSNLKIFKGNNICHSKYVCGRYGWPL